MTAATILRGVGALALAVGLFAAGAPGAHAMTGPNVGVRLHSFTPSATPGGSATFEIRLEAREAMMIENLRVEAASPRANVRGETPAAATMLPAGQTRILSFTGEGLDEAGDVRVRFTANGRPVVKRFDFSRANREKQRRPHAMIQVDDAGPGDGPHAPGLLIPGPGRPRQRGADEKPVRIAKPTDASAANALIRVRGQVSYIRDDGVRIGADAVTIRVYDEDWDWDELVAEFRTETNGQFDRTLSFSEDEPDIYLEIETTNAAVTVEDGSFWETNYVFRTGVHTDYTGNDLFWGTLQPADESLYPSLHIHTNMTRAWRWWAQQRDQTPEHLEVQWPDSDWPHYDGSEIHIPQAVDGTIYGWESGTHVHEYAHHLHYQFFTREDSDYDNGICNNPNGDPGHCAWCQETGPTAVNEGWPNWYSTYVLERYPQMYSSSAIHMKNTEWLGACAYNGISCDCDPDRTEGFFQVLFRDLEDDTPAEQDPRSEDEHAFDKIDLSVHDVLNAMQLGAVTRASQLVPAVKAFGPSISASDWWHTLNNAGFATPDVGKPTLPGLFYSTSHTTNESSTRRAIFVEWQPGVDLESGIRGYYLYVGTTLRAPNTGDELVAAEHSQWASHSLDVPGPYYVSIRAVDFAGNLSNDWKWVGPYTLRNPQPADMEATTPAGNGWYRPLVARDAGDASGNTIQPTASLPGDTPGTWVNVYGRNHGEVSALSNSVKIKVDGKTVHTEPVSTLNAGSGVAKLNLGPIEVRGGRHAIEAYWEADEEISENSESDNDYRTQYTWLPYTFASIPIGAVLRDAPPMRDAGRLGMDPTQTFYWNVDGLRFRHRSNPFAAMTSYWSGVTLDPVNPYSDYDLRLHAASNLSGIGFDTVVGSSTRSAGLLDAVFSNRRAHTTDTWDIGVLNADSSSGQYRARLLQAPLTSLVVGDTATITMGAHMLMTLRELSTGNGGPVEVIVQVTNGPLDLYALRFSTTFQKGGIDDYAQKVAANDDGRIVMSFNMVSDTHVPLVIYRNPSTSRPESTVTFHLTIRKPLADLVASTPNTFWHAPLVPKESSASYFMGVPAPEALIGDAQQTWLNYTYANLDAAFGGLAYNRVRLDDDLIHTRLNNGMTADQRHTSFNVGPFTIAGGRHVLSLALDNNNAVAEESEANNLWGEQWVWRPDSIGYDEGSVRAGTVGTMTARWGYVTVNEVLYPNADGVRLPWPPAPTHWFGVGVMPREGSDVDLQLHEVSTGPKDGFENASVTSAWGEGQLDYVLINHDQVFRRPFDVGVVRQSTDTSSYVVQAQRAVLWSPATGTRTIRLEPRVMLDLYEFDLTPDTWRFQLVQTGTSSPTDWGMALHRRESFFTYSSRSEGDSLSSYVAGTSQPESFVANITQAGRYCLAVWRNDPADVDVYETARASITITAGTLATDGTLPSRTGLRSAWPNPVRDHSTLRFDLAREGDVTLEVYDVRGSLVRTLARGPFAAGRHEASWDGRDDRGSLLPPGLYLARLNANGETSTLKLSRLD